jgi:hypothetical protein
VAIIAKTNCYCQAIIGVLSVVKGLTELDIQKRMVRKRNGCTVKGEGENVSAPILLFIKESSNVYNTINIRKTQLVPFNFYYYLSQEFKVTYVNPYTPVG